MLERVLIEVRGTVQGVGFRPFVHSLASALRLRGFVQNRGTHVFIDVEGDRDALASFVQSVSISPPPLAAIESVQCRPAPLTHHNRLAISPSAVTSEHDIRIAPDVATCDACLAELFDPGDRRHRYPFINCTACGPRFTIVTGAPYDRTRTTMAAFDMCGDCRREYEDPQDRRFHAEPIACARCGPLLVARDTTTGDPIGGDPVSIAAEALLAGRIVALKGLGGYHLACDATDDHAVAELRRRKRRDAKPFAAMIDAGALDPEALGAAGDTLVSRERPIVLIEMESWRKSGGPALSPAVAPGCAAVGVMLPYTPLHHLLMHDIARPLVMTSGNTTDEPIAFEDRDAWERLRGIADIIVAHGRAIHARCDDSVTRVIAGAPSVLRRGRGHVPAAITLSEEAPVPVLAVGAHLKNTFCLLSGRRAWLSPHIGDLENLAAYTALRDGVRHYMRLAGVEPRVVVHDRHPDYLSTRFASEFPAEQRLAVQHHHAHVLSSVAEHGCDGPVIGVAFDGSGLGDDGAVWGGEFLFVDGTASERACHLAYVPLPGGDAAAKEPWRMALAHLRAAFGTGSDTVAEQVLHRIPLPTRQSVTQLIDRGIAAPPTSSVGRLFDAVASLIGLRDHSEFEGQAAMQLEALAGSARCEPYVFDVDRSSEPWTIEPARVIRAIAADVQAGRDLGEMASAFHQGLALVIADVAVHLARRTSVNRVALTGGVFQNARLTELTAAALSSTGLEPLIHRRVPCNDGGVSLGQALYAARVTSERS